MSKNDVVPRGPARWERAARNAIRRPNSQAAVLFIERYNVARELVREAKAREVDTQAPFRFEHNVWDGGERRWTGVYSTCGMFCMSMQAQLDVPRAVGEDSVRAVLDGGRYVRVIALDTKKMARSVRCQVCGGTIRRG